MSQFSPPYQVTIVDDDEDITDVMVDFIHNTKSGEFECKVFHDPNEALEHIKKNNVHLVLSDINMPNLHGESFLREVRNLDKGIYVVVMTGEPTLTRILSSKSNCDLGFVIKPFDYEQLTTIIKTFVVCMESWNLTVRKMISG